MRTALVAFSVLLVASALCQAGQVTVVNGGFETGDFTGWTQSGSASFVGVSTSAAFTGSYGAFFGAIGDNNIISQDVVTTAGDVYDLSFRLNGNSVGGIGAINVLWGGVSVWDSVNGSFAWDQINLTGLVGQAGSTALQFQFRDDPSFYYLDDVGVPGDAAVPEPATLLMFGAGALVLGIRRFF
jgi:hypothetical protein